MTVKRCVVCLGPRQEEWNVICYACCRDHAKAASASIQATITWAARRARRFERARARRAEYGPRAARRKG